MSDVNCTLCFHGCRLSEGVTGLCGARENRGGRVVSNNYGRLTSLALDPIEKKPLQRFYPKSRVLSVGSYGCNLSCPFCQNYEISRQSKEAYLALPERAKLEMSPEALVKLAVRLRAEGNIGIAFTYNEPTVGFEYVRDTAELAREKDLKTVLVSNGSLCEQAWRELCLLIDAMNIDLKVFSEAGYRSLGGDFESVKRNISAAVSLGCHVELTTLVVPGLSDREEDMEAEAEYLSSISPEIPLHISRFFPRYRMSGRRPTDVSLVYRLAEIARRHLHYVYTGNC